jgi:DNA repair protein RadA/Sms
MTHPNEPRQPQTNGTTPDDLDALLEEETQEPAWEERPLARQQEDMLTYFSPADWLSPKGLAVGMQLRHDDRQWYPWKALAKERGVDVFGYERAIDKAIQDLMGPRGSPPARGTPLVTHMETVQARAIDWLWYPYIAIGKICICDGDPGVGKTLFATQLAANVSRGYPMPDQHGLPTLACGDPGIVIFIATEDDLEDTVKPRLERAGADCSKVKAFNEWEDGAGQIHTFTLADLSHLETVLQRYHPRLVYIDAIQSVLGGKVDANSANQLKALLDPLAKLARTYRCAMLASRHPAKPGQNNVKLIYRGANSMAILGTARLGLFAEDHPTDKTKVLLLQSKSNAGAIGRTQIFSKAGGQFEWAGVSRITKEDLAGPTHGPDSRGWLEAYFWLERRLEGGLAWNATDIEQEAELQDLSPKALKRAKKALGVVSSQIKGEAHAGWTWRLPPLPPTPPSLYSVY